MAEPKKETVRIVLPPRKDGQPATSTPRETVMLNLPKKPEPIPPGGAPKPPSPPSGGPSLPKPPAPPSSGSGVSLPKPPAPPSTSGASKPLTPPTPPTSSTPPQPPGDAASTPPKPPGSSGGGIAPAPLKTSPKKETAKVPAGAPASKPLPQATVTLTKPAAPSQVSTGASSIKIQPGTITTGAGGSESPVLPIAALVAALIALGIQLWIML